MIEMDPIASILPRLGHAEVAIQALDSRLKRIEDRLGAPDPLPDDAGGRSSVRGAQVGRAEPQVGVPGPGGRGA